MNAAPLTMMSDPRVVRGNTHALARKISKARKEESQVPKTEILRLRLQDSMESQPSSSMPYYNFVTKPFADGDVDVMQYLVESEEYVVKKRDIDTQVDQFNPAPPLVTFIPRKTGIDQYTQVENVSDIFVFDLEVAPMLDVIVRKTMEQALVEVEHEEELKRLQEEVSNFEKQMSHEAKWMHEQEEHIKHNQESIRNQLESVLASKRSEHDVKTRVAGLQMMRQIFPGMFDSITESNIAEGNWYVPEKMNVETNVNPDLKKDARRNIAALGNASEVIDGKCECRHDYRHEANGLCNRYFTRS